MSKKLHLLRKEINLIDKSLLKLLAKRFRVAVKIGKLKRQYGFPVFIPSREKEVLASRLFIAKKLGLSELFTTVLMKKIMNESKAIQRMNHQKQKAFKSKKNAKKISR